LKVIREIYKMYLSIQDLKHNFDLALKHHQQGNFKEAEKLYNKILKNFPDHFQTIFHLGTLFAQIKKYKAAIISLKKAIQINPGYLNTYNNLGNVYREIGSNQEAISCYQKIIKTDSNYIAYINIGGVFKDLGKHSEAIKMFQKANEINPNHLSAYWLSLNTFPVIYKNIKELGIYRNRFIENINKLHQLILKNKNHTKNEILEALQTSTNFYLHYQGKDDLVLQTQYAKFIEKLTKKIYPQFHRKKIKKKLSKKIKIGFISSSFKNHTVGHLFKNWIFKINRNFFSTFVYFVGNKLDQTTDKIKKNSDCFFNHTHIDVLINQISKDKLNVLIYIDIGMEPAIQVLTSLRLADIQCTTWGHPVSSGFKHIDYFFSSELMEKNDSQKNYSEKLIKLPNLAIDFDLPNLSTTQTSKNIKKTNKIIFLNLQSLFKLLPSHDHIYFDIIKKINNCQFWFVEDLKKSITTLFKNRIAKFCRYYDLSFDKYFLFHQKMKQPDFFNLIKQSDVILDSLEWSGGKTSLDAIALHKPMVTLPGKLMRGRHTYGILKLLNLEQTIASSKKEYVKIAIKLATDKNFRNMISNKIKINKNRIYNDETPIRFLEQFFKNEFKI